MQNKRIRVNLTTSVFNPHVLPFVHHLNYIELTIMPPYNIYCDLMAQHSAMVFTNPLARRYYEYHDDLTTYFLFSYFLIGLFVFASLMIVYCWRSRDAEQIVLNQGAIETRLVSFLFTYFTGENFNMACVYGAKLNCDKMGLRGETQEKTEI